MGFSALAASKRLENARFQGVLLERNGAKKY
jgi:hypothetical protein